MDTPCPPVLPDRVTRETIRAFRENSDRQQDFFREVLNAAIARVGGDRVFAPAEALKCWSYWYILNVLIEEWSLAHDPYALDPGALGYSDPVLSMSDLHARVDNRFKAETLRRYVGDLCGFRLIQRDGRGHAGQLRLSFVAIVAIVVAFAHWVEQFQTLHGELAARGAFALLHRRGEWWSATLAAEPPR